MSWARLLLHRDARGAVLALPLESDAPAAVGGVGCCCLPRPEGSRSTRLETTQRLEPASCFR